MMPSTMRQHPRALPNLVERFSSMSKHSIYRIDGPSHLPYIGRTRNTLGQRISEHRYGSCSPWCTPESDIIEIDTAANARDAAWLEWWNVWFIGLPNLQNSNLPGTTSAETRQKMREARLGYKMSDASRAKLSASKTGTKASAETRAKLSATHTGSGNGMYGKAHSEETRAKMKARAKVRPRKQCPHCGMVCVVSNYNRYHGDNCKRAQR